MKFIISLLVVNVLLSAVALAFLWMLRRELRAQGELITNEFELHRGALANTIRALKIDEEG